VESFLNASRQIITFGFFISNNIFPIYLGLNIFFLKLL
jgi:hypothetical protein